jgi:hypothetical protein
VAKGRGIAFDQENQVAAFGEQFDGAGGGARPGLGQNLGIARHRENQFVGIGRNGRPPRSTMDSA